MSWMLRAYFDTNVYERGSWLADMLDASSASLTDPKLPPREKRSRVTFEQFFDAGAEDLAEDLAKPLGCDAACRARGLGGLAPVPAVRLCVGVCQSQIYAQVVGTPGQPDVRRPDPADGYDVWHAILASTGQVFLTLDRRLAADVERVPDIGVRVARSAGDLLAMAEELPRGGRQL